MSKGTPVVIDTCNIDRLHQIDQQCDLIDFIVATFGDFGVGDVAQLRRKTKCPHLANVLADHGTSDGEVAAFVGGYSGSCALHRIIEDPADIRLLVCALKYPSSMLVSCDRRLLMIAAEQGQRRACFKAAIHQVDQSVGGLFVDKSFGMSAMFDAAGADPYFHYPRNTRCSGCDPKSTCNTRQSPPSLP